MSVSYQSVNPGMIRSRCPHVLAAAALGFSLVPWVSAYAAPLLGEFKGGAASLSVSAGGAEIELQVNNSARVGCPCNGTHGNTRTRTTSAISVGPQGSVISAALTTATASAGKTVSTAETQQTSTITKLNLFGGLITADALEAVASVSATPDGLTASEAGTTLSNLTIAGKAIDPGVPDNTVVALPGIGSITIKAAETHTGKNAAHAGMDVLLVDVTHTNGFLPVGARLVVARADAGFKRTQPPASLGGYAAGARVRGDAGNPLDEMAGAGSGVGLASCDGTGGKTDTKSVTDVSVPGFLSIGTETETAFGGPAGQADVAKTTSTLSNISFLNGLIEADGLTAVAQASRMADATTTSAAGSGVNNLKIAGLAIKIGTQPNTKVAIPDLG